MWPAIITGALSGLFKLVDDLHTSTEEKAQIKEKLVKTQADLTAKALEYESTLRELQAKVIEAEAKGQSFLQRNWRPIIMLEFGFIIFWNYIVSPIFAQNRLEIPPDMWSLLKIGLGGYVIGRTAEKIAPQIIEARRKRD